MEDIIMKRLEAECFGARTIEIYGGAYHLARQYDEPSLQDIASRAVMAIKNAKYWEPEVSPQTIAQRFCSLFYVDFMLIEALCNFRFSDLK